jgi:hypothetical protein
MRHDSALPRKNFGKLAIGLALPCSDDGPKETPEYASFSGRVVQVRRIGGDVNTCRDRGHVQLR